MMRSKKIVISVSAVALVGAVLATAVVANASTVGVDVLSVKEVNSVGATFSGFGSLMTGDELDMEKVAAVLENGKEVGSVDAAFSEFGSLMTGDELDMEKVKFVLENSDKN